MGKTSLACRLVENRGLTLTADSNWVVIDRYPDISPKWERRPYGGFSQIEAIVEAHEEGIKPWCDFDTILWDPCSQAVNIEQRRAAKVFGREVEEWPDYRITANRLSDIIQLLNKSSFNVILTAHLRFPNDKDAEKGLYAVRPNMPEACYNIVAREVQLIGYMFRDDVGEKRKIQFQPTKRVTAKSQIPTIPEGVYNAEDVPALVRKWKYGNE